MQGVTASARRAEDQKRWVMLAAIGGIVVGMALWAVFAGIVARAVPASWQWPEKMAARTLAMPMWEGGQRMMQAGDAQAFANVTAANRLVIANRSALAGCAKRADRTGNLVQCSIAVEPTRIGRR
nr:DUF6118 family protein [Sphingomonas sp. JXJ CY 53]